MIRIRLSVQMPIIALCITLLFVTCQIGEANDSLMPDNIIIEQQFIPGKGPPIGHVQFLQGISYVIHDQVLKAYIAKQNLPLYVNDTLIVMDKSRINLIFNDQSSITLGSHTKFSINRMVFNPDQKYRVAYSNLQIGKGRFRVKDYKDYQHASYRIKTPTAIVGVRGSDFIIRATLTQTRVDTLKHTKLSLISLAAPEEIPLLMDEFEWVIIEQDAQLPSTVETLLPEDADSLIREFSFDTESTELNENNMPDEKDNHESPKPTDDDQQDDDRPSYQIDYDDQLKQTIENNFIDPTPEETEISTEPIETKDEFDEASDTQKEVSEQKKENISTMPWFPKQP